MSMSKKTEISIVIPVKNESGNIDNLLKEINKYLKYINYEIIYVNDGSTDNTELDESEDNIFSKCLISLNK